MIRYMLVVVIFIAGACSDDKVHREGSLQGDIYLDTIENKDSIEVRGEVILPEDNTKVVDSAEGSIYYNGNQAGHPE